MRPSRLVSALLPTVLLSSLVPSISSIAAAQTTTYSGHIVVQQIGDGNQVIINNAPPSVVYVDRHWRPRELSYEEGDRVPDGFHLEERRNKGLIIAGSIVGGVGVLGFLASASAASRSDAYSSYGSSSSRSSESSGGLMIATGLMAIGGLAMLLVGLSTKKILVEDRPTFDVGVAPLKGGAGFSLSGTF